MLLPSVSHRNRWSVIWIVALYVLAPPGCSKSYDVLSVACMCRPRCFCRQTTRWTTRSMYQVRLGISVEVFSKNWKYSIHEKLNCMFSGTAQVSHQEFQFFCQFCLLVRVTMVDKNKAVLCCLLATSAVMLSEKNAYFLYPRFQVTICRLRWTQGSPLFYLFWKVEYLEMMPSWCRQVNWGNCGIPWVNCAVLCAWKTTGKDSSEACFFACQNCAVYSVFTSVMTPPSKIAQFNWECIARFIYYPVWTIIRLKAIMTRDFSVIFLLKIRDIIFQSWRDFCVSTQAIVSVHICVLNIGHLKFLQMK